MKLKLFVVVATAVEVVEGHDVAMQSKMEQDQTTIETTTRQQTTLLQQLFVVDVTIEAKREQQQTTVFDCT